MPDTGTYLPSFVRARKEALWILLSFAVCLVWTIGYSALTGYEIDTENLKLILGFPSWVFWGVAIPWIVATLFSIWFAMRVLESEEAEVSDEDAGGATQ